MPEPGEQSDVVEAIYTHPLGGTITVFTDGTFIAIGANGKRKNTTATVEKLAAGHGLWKKTGPGDE